jgi:hypothetical protein
VKRLLIGVTAMTLLAGTVWYAASAARRDRRLNVLLITIDTLRADHLGGYGYAAAQTPALDALAARGLRFAQATTVAPLTLPAHASLMTGTFPAYHGVRDNGGFYLGDDQVTLAKVLRARGYRTGGFVSAFVLDGRWGIGILHVRFWRGCTSTSRTHPTMRPTRSASGFRPRWPAPTMRKSPPRTSRWHGSSITSPPRGASIARW